MSTVRSLLVFRIVLTVGLAALAPPMNAASSLFPEDARWQVSIAALQVSADPYLPPGSSYDSSGAELGLSYRLSDRVGLGLTAIEHDIENQFGIDFFGPLFGFETSYRSTWLMARADFHLTPNRRVDLVLSPLVGYQRTRNIVERVSFDVFGLEELTIAFEPDEGLALGARLAMDIPLGRTPGRSSLTVGLTYLHSQIETASRTGSALEETLEFDLEPVAIHVGYAFRF